MTTLERAATLGEDALAKIFARYGRPLELTAPLDVEVTVGALALGTLSYRSPVDVIANDWFVLVPSERMKGERSAVAAPLFTALVDRLTGRFTGL